MNSIVCTLFEKHYHYGLAALANSLYQHGFRGSVYAGYRGELPQWCATAKEEDEGPWPGARIVEIDQSFRIYLLPVETDFHLTNYKPYFMLQLLEVFGKQADAIAYFDPDIVVKCRWGFFETWISHGVALVHEITANDMPATHPIRRQWEEVISRLNRKVVRDLHSYINGGFCGVAKSNTGFLQLWADTMNMAIQHYNLKPGSFMPSDRTQPFFASDQDALNITAMSCQCPISEIGPEGMDLDYGGWTMSHAVGAPKPWKKRYIRSALKGSPPSITDRAYWQYVHGPIRCYSAIAVKYKRTTLHIAALIGRFYRRY